MDLSFLPSSIQGPLRSWLLLIVAALIASSIAFAVHRLGAMLLRRLVRRRPFALNAIQAAYGIARTCLLLFALRLVLSGAPDDVPYVTNASYIVTILLILSLTWLAIRCVNSVSSTVVELNPYDVADNLRARRILTQTRVLARSANFIAALLGLSFMLLTLPGARQFGASLLASAGVAGLVAGMAARPVLSNFIAGLQIAFSQPIRIDDVLIVKGEWGRVEEITGTYVVVRIWDERRMIVPLQWFIENPFENWTHKSSTILGTVFLWLDFSVPLDSVKSAFEKVCKSSALWDGRVCVMQVTDANERAMQLRLLVSARNSGEAFDLRCLIRESVIRHIAEHHPSGLPRLRTSLDPLEIDSGGPARADDMGAIVDGHPREASAHA